MCYYSQTFNPFPGINEYYPTIIFSPAGDDPGNSSKKETLTRFFPSKNKSTYVILADDDTDDRELFTEAVEESGLEVKLKCVEDGNELLSLLRNTGSQLPNVIFLDLNMPNVNGKECLDEIRRTEHLKHIPVVIYSTSSSINDIDETFNQGANLYVKKPSSFRDLLAITRQVLSLDWESMKKGVSRSEYVFNIKT